MLAAGTMLGPYKVLAPLGAGGMGEVYRARDTRLGRDVALKVIPAELARSPDRIKRFEQEARAAGALNHPNVCAIFDIGTHDGSPFVVMELLEGESLRSRLNQGPIPARKAIDWAAQAAHGLAAAHEKGIVHRDLKPENLFLTKDGRVKVLDFGLAKLTQPEVFAPSGEPPVSVVSSETGAILGTAGYMAPEQVRGEPADQRADLFALGSILYELLAGKRAFAGVTFVEASYRILSEDPPPLNASGRAIAPGLEAIMRRCLEKSPEERFQSARDLAFGLESVSEIAPGSTLRAQTQGDRTRARSRRGYLAAALLAVALLSAGTVFLVVRKAKEPAEPGHERREIAVLPFQNLSDEGPNAYFAGGLHDELLTQLSKVAALKVISRTSVMGYQGATKPLRQIADELGVGSLVEGTVQVVGGRLRVNVQLIDAASDRHLWAERYDRTLDDAFAIQSEVAQQIVAAVGTVLTSSEQRGLATAPTVNPEAYRLYLQGRDYYFRAGNLRHDTEVAQRLYERALGLDPDFALAHAALSQVHGRVLWLKYDPSPSRFVHQREEAEIALRLAPDLPQAHIAMGLAHYWGRRDYRRALDEFTLALKDLPNDASLWMWIGAVHRRLGNWDEVFAAFGKAAQLDPRNTDVFGDLGGASYQCVHRYAEAVRAYDQALSLAPDLHGIAVSRGYAFVIWQGHLDTMRAVLNRLPREAELGVWGGVPAHLVRLLWWERNADGLLQMLQSVHDRVFEGQQYFLPSAQAAAYAYQLRGDHTLAQAAFDSALVLVDSAMKRLPDDPRVHAARGLVLAGLGRRDEALDEARWLQRSEEYGKDAFGGPYVAEDRARILAQAGDVNAALDEIERLLAGPSFLSVHTLRLDPSWDPIREHPRFKALLVEHGGRGLRGRFSGREGPGLGRQTRGPDSAKPLAEGSRRLESGLETILVTHPSGCHARLDPSPGRIAGGVRDQHKIH